jgi:hypothetical protein
MSDDSTIRERLLELIAGWPRGGCKADIALTLRSCKDENSLRNKVQACIKNWIRISRDSKCGWSERSRLRDHAIEVGGVLRDPDTEMLCSLYGAPSEEESDKIVAMLPSISFDQGVLLGVHVEDAPGVWQLMGSNQLVLEGSNGNQLWEAVEPGNISRFRFWRIRRRT